MYIEIPIICAMNVKNVVLHNFKIIQSLKNIIVQLKHRLKVYYKMTCKNF